nr:hypothetical protein [Micromonospora sp. DSM 115978]
MSLPIALAVQLRTGRTNRQVTSQVRDLVLRWTDPGGYASAQIALDRPLDGQPDEIAYYGRLLVTDARHGGIVWDGELEDPGRSNSGDGQVWDLAAIGGQSHTRDRTVPLIYIDRDLSRWTEVETTACPDGQRSVTEDEVIFPGQPSLIHRIPDGTPVRASSATHVSTRYLPLYRSGQALARINYQWDAGRSDASLRIRTYVRNTATWSTSPTLARDDAANTAGGAASARVIDTNWTAGRDGPEVRLQWTGSASVIGDDVTWAAFADLVVQATRYDAGGTELTTGASYTTDSVLASQVVADLLGRLLPTYDGAGATIATTTHPIEQLAYPDGVTPDRVLADLLALEAGHTWRVWERTPAGFQFEFVELPTVVRYEASVIDGYSAPGSADGLYDRVTVRWVDPTGQPRTTARTATVPELTAAGRTRQGWLDLGADVASDSDAERAGDQWLADRGTPPNAGRLVVARPILDRETGRMVQPWEIRPGLIRVRGILPRPDALNASGRDGVTVFRIVAGEYRARDGAATLELDSHAPSTARQVAELRRRPTIVRRR